MDKSRRKFIKSAGYSAVAVGLGSFVVPSLTGCSKSKRSSETSGGGDSAEAQDLFFSISLAQWSLNRQLFSGQLDNLDFANVARKEFDISAIEYVNQFFKDKAEDKAYLTEMKKRAGDNGVKSLLIMVDGEGNLGDPDEAARNRAVENHYKWVEAAKFLGCHSIRVNAGASKGTAKEVMEAAVQGLGKLTEFGAEHNINIIVENHGGYSSNGEWLSSVISKVGHKMCGTLPDFGNFCIKSGQKEGKYICTEEYDRYKGVKELMPYAKGVSAKAYEFDENGNEKTIDFHKMIKIVHDAGFTGHIGIEFEGQGDAYEGIRKTKALLARVGAEFS